MGGPRPTEVVGRRGAGRQAAAAGHRAKVVGRLAEVDRLAAAAASEEAAVAENGKVQIGIAQPVVPPSHRCPSSQ